MQNTNNILPCGKCPTAQEVETTTTPEYASTASVEIPCIIRDVQLTDATGKVTTLTVYRVYEGPTEAQIAAVDMSGERVVLDTTAVQVSEHELVLATVADDNIASRALILMYNPLHKAKGIVYKALGIVRQSYTEQDGNDITAVYNALMADEEHRAYLRNDKRVEIVPEGDPRAVTHVYDPAQMQIVYRVRESDRRNDVRRISKRLRDKFGSIPTTTEGGTTDAE